MTLVAKSTIMIVGRLTVGKNRKKWQKTKFFEIKKINFLETRWCIKTNIFSKKQNSALECLLYIVKAGNSKHKNIGKIYYFYDFFSIKKVFLANN